MTSNDRLDAIEKILATTAVQQQANSEAIARLEAQILTNSTAIDQLTDRVDRLTSRVDDLVLPIQSEPEALRLISEQHDRWLEQMRSIQGEIYDIRQEINNHIRDSDNENG